MSPFELKEQIESRDNFDAIFLGKCLINNNDRNNNNQIGKKIVKSATRKIVKSMFTKTQRNRHNNNNGIIKDNLQIDSSEVIIEVRCDQIIVSKRKFIDLSPNDYYDNRNHEINDEYNNDRLPMFEWKKNNISSCFILREDKRIITIVAHNNENDNYQPLSSSMDGQLNAHVFYMANKSIVNQLMNILYEMLIDDDRSNRRLATLENVVSSSSSNSSSAPILIGDNKCLTSKRRNDGQCLGRQQQQQQHETIKDNHVQLINL